jgi:hypothetical protein
MEKIMSAHATVLPVRLCSPVDPSIRYQSLYTRVIDGATCHLRLVYVADDDLVFINRCAHGMGAAEAANHKQPYLSIALSGFSQAFILDYNHASMGVAEVHQAPYWAEEEWEYKTGDYLVRFFWSEEVAVPQQGTLITFFAGYCHLFPEVKRLVAAVYEEEPGEAFTAAGFTPVQAPRRTTVKYYVHALEGPA